MSIDRSFFLIAKGVTAFGEQDPKQRRHDGDRNALWFFIIALISTCTITVQNGLFAQSAAELTNKLRSLSFRAILRQDVEYFDKDENNVSLIALQIHMQELTAQM